MSFLLHDNLLQVKLLMSHTHTPTHTYTVCSFNAPTFLYTYIYTLINRRTHTYTHRESSHLIWVWKHFRANEREIHEITIALICRGMYWLQTVRRRQELGWRVCLGVLLIRNTNNSSMPQSVMWKGFCANAYLPYCFEYVSMHACRCLCVGAFVCAADALYNRIQCTHFFSLSIKSLSSSSSAPLAETFCFHFAVVFVFFVFYRCFCSQLASSQKLCFRAAKRLSGCGGVWNFLFLLPFVNFSFFVAFQCATAIWRATITVAQRRAILPNKSMQGAFEYNTYI